MNEKNTLLSEPCNLFSKICCLARLSRTVKLRDQRSLNSLKFIPGFQVLDKYWLSNRHNFLAYLIYQDKTEQEQGQFGLGLIQD